MARSRWLVALGWLAACSPGDSGIPDARHSLFAVTTSSVQPVAGVDLATLTVTLADPYGHRIVDRPVAFTATGARNTLAPAATCTTDSSGSCSITLSTLTAEEKDLQAFVASRVAADPTVDTLFALDGSVVFYAGPPSLAMSSAVASPTMLAADGIATTTLTLTARDANGNVVAGDDVTVRGPTGALDVLGASSGVTAADGTFSTTLASATAGTQVITFTVRGVDIATGPIEFQRVGGGPWQMANGTMWGGLAHGIAFTPPGGTAGVAYAATNNGMYYTSDGGQVWTRRSSGISGATVASVVMASLDGSVALASVYGGDAGDGVYRTSNSGASWQRVHAGQTWLLTSVVENGAFVLYLLDSTYTVFRSTDGVTWLSIGMPTVSSTVPEAMFVDPRTDIVYVGGDNVYSNAGGTWAPAGTGLPPSTQASVRSLALDATSNPAVLWVGMTTGLYRGNATAAHDMAFSSVGSGLTDVIALAADPGTAGYVYAASGTTVVRSTDGGTSFAQLTQLAAVLDPVSRIMIDPKDPTTGYFLLDGYPYWPVSGSWSPWKSTNLHAAASSVTAAPANVGMDAQSGHLLQQHPTAPSTLAVAGASLYVTTDGAATWTDIVARNGTSVTLTASAWVGLGFDAAGTIYAADGQQIVRAQGTSPLVSVAPPKGMWTFGVSPVLTGTFFAFGWDGAFYGCTDPCASWTPITLPSGMYVWGMSFGRAPGAQGQAPIYVYGQGGAAVSRDGGATFTALAQFAGVYVRDLSVDPLDADRIALSPLGGGLYLSSDGGATFTAIGTSFGSQAEGLIAIDSRTSPITLYFSAETLPGMTATLYRSTDAGTTWQAAGDGLDGAWFSAMWLDTQASGPVIYGGSFVRGVFKTTTGGL